MKGFCCFWSLGVRGSRTWRAWGVYSCGLHSILSEHIGHVPRCEDIVFPQVALHSGMISGLIRSWHASMLITLHILLPFIRLRRFFCAASPGCRLRLRRYLMMTCLMLSGSDMRCSLTRGGPFGLTLRYHAGGFYMALP